MSHERSVTHPLAGAVRYRFETPASRAPVKLLEGYEQNLERVRVPQLAAVPRRPESGTNSAAEMEPDPWVLFHRSAAAQLQEAFSEVEAEGLLDQVLAFGGEFEPRLRSVLPPGSSPALPRGSGTNSAAEMEPDPLAYTTELSAHALGLAVDLNPVENPLGQDGCRGWRVRHQFADEMEPDPPGGLRELAPLFERHGFRWGGYDKPCNASHFEVARFLQPGETLELFSLHADPTGDV
ncbi:MAG: M15 family metallopeptidase [Armatimonadetes bacterium]|nr:M15 family metallopeptidase [Armatimonadota bacterium]